MSAHAPSRKTARGEASRRRILDAATQLICERGYSGTSVDAVCKRAGVVKTALYWHFGSKSGLLFLMSLLAGEVITPRSFPVSIIVLGCQIIISEAKIISSYQV